MNQQIYNNRKGVALVVVMLVILAATAIALVSIKIMQNETRMTMALKYNRQAAQVANQVGLFIGDKLGESTSLEIAAEAKRNAIEQAYATLKDGGTSNDAWNSMNSGAIWYFPSEIAPYTGLTAVSGGGTDTNEVKYFKGDLSRPIIQAGSIGNLTLNQTQVEGFSNADAFCSESVHADSYALVGRPVQLRKAGDQDYYLLADINTRVSGYKREMGIYLLDPLPCN